MAVIFCVYTLFPIFDQAFIIYTLLNEQISKNRWWDQFSYVRERKEKG